MKLLLFFFLDFFPTKTEHISLENVFIYLNIYIY